MNVPTLRLLLNGELNTEIYETENQQKCPAKLFTPLEAAVSKETWFVPMQKQPIVKRHGASFINSAVIWDLLLQNCWVFALKSRSTLCQAHGHASTFLSILRSIAPYYKSRPKPKSTTIVTPGNFSLGIPPPWIGQLRLGECFPAKAHEFPPSNMASSGDI